MVRKYVRKTNRVQYTSQDMQNALQAVRNGEPLRRVANQFAIPPRTLRRHRDCGVAHPDLTILGRYRPDLSPEHEEILVQHVQLMEKSFFGLSSTDVRRLAYDYATKLGLRNTFNRECQMAGKDWFISFLKRHPNLSVHKAEGMNMARLCGFNRQQVDRFFSVYKDLIDSDSYTPMRVWNADETGISCVQSPGYVVATKGSRDVARVISAERGKNVTVLCAQNAAGIYVPPMFIFPRQRMAEGLMNNAPPGSIAHCSASGWADSDSFLKWLQHFVSVAKPLPQEKHIIILDGHHSHKSLAAIEYARENGIEMITLPPHLTHKMQPLDKAFFFPLKTAYNKACNAWMSSNKGKRISMYQIAELFGSAYNSCATVEKAVNGFRACGLWPFNDSVFGDDAFVASQLTEEPDHVAAHSSIPTLNVVPNTDSIEAAHSRHDANTPTIATEPNIATLPQCRAYVPLGATEDNNTTPTQSNACTPTPSDTEFEIITQPERSVCIQPRETNNDNPLLMQNISDIEVRTEIDSGTQAAQSNCASDFVKGLLNKVKASNCRQRKRKTEKSEILTSSPYKKILVEKEQNKKKSLSKNTKKAKPTKKKQATKIKRSESLSQSDEEDETWSCLVCGEPFGDSKPGEIWVKCITCKLWSHEDCTAGEKEYICRNCDSDDDC